MVRYKYNDERDPPAPFVYVTISGQDGATPEKQIPAQVDSGADRTVIPRTAVNELGLQRVRDLLIGGFGGTAVELPTYLVQLAFTTSSVSRLRSSRMPPSRSFSSAGT